MLGNIAKLMSSKVAGGPVRRNISATSTSTNIFKIRDVNDFNKRVLKAQQPVVVGFFAKWCNLCKMQAPKTEQVIKELDGKVSLAEVDIDETEEIKQKYGIKSVPVLAVYRNGSITKILAGVHEMDDIKSFVKTNIGE